MIRKLLLLSIVTLLSVGVGVLAQPDAPATTRDPLALAQRYLGYDGEPILMPVTPRYSVGDTLDFWVSQIDAPVRVSAVLAAETPTIYLWVEAGLDYDPAEMGVFAGQMSAIYEIFQLRETYGLPFRLPGLGTVSDPTARLHIPDVDNDPHLYLLYTTDLKEDRDAVFNPNDSLPAALAPGGISNQHEIIYLNTTPYTEVPLSDGLYLNTLATAIYQFIMSVNNPTQAPWLAEALNLSLRQRIQQATISAADAQTFLDEAGHSIVRLPGLTNRTQVVNGQQLFLNYLFQRYGSEPYLNLFQQSGEGVQPLDAALREQNVIDLVSGAPVTGRDVFADFVLANLLNFPLGDGRYIHTITPLEESQRAARTAIASLEDAKFLGQSVNQFGSAYFSYSAQTTQTVVLRFAGTDTTARFDMPFGFDADDPFYWSGGAAGQDTTMTRAIDLSAVESATLTFDVWHDLADEWNYGYVSVSTDDGTSWTPLPSQSDERGTTTANRHGIAYGPSFTGISNPQGPRPFPIVGIVIAEDGMTLGEISPDSPAEQAGLRAGDVVVGYDGEVWSGVPNIVGLLSNYSPGDTVNFYVQRGSQRFSMPVVLGAHPTRVVQPAPLWLPQTVDLTPFTGGEILLRFEYISVTGRENGGFAINNIAIPEIGYTDDDQWTLNGWQIVTNTLPQQWLVQSVTTGTTDIPPHVRPLIGVDSEANSGEWTFTLQPSEILFIAIAGLNDDTLQPAAFSLELSAD